MQLARLLRSADVPSFAVISKSQNGDLFSLIFKTGLFLAHILINFVCFEFAFIFWLFAICRDFTADLKLINYAKVRWFWSSVIYISSFFRFSIFYFFALIQTRFTDLIELYQCLSTIQFDACQVHFGAENGETWTEREKQKMTNGVGESVVCLTAILALMLLAGRYCT